MPPTRTMFTPMPTATLGPWLGLVSNAMAMAPATDSASIAW